MSQATLSQRPYVNSNLFSAHYLDERVREREEWNCDEEALEAMEELQSLYDLEGSLVSGYGEDALIDNWIDEVLEVLGFGTQDEVTLPDGGGFVDELLFVDPTARRDAASVFLDTEDTTDLFERGIGLVEAKQWDADFTERFSEQRPYYNASQQIKRYLEKTPENVQWGVLTNGRKWRLYGTNDYETQTFYEIDLPELLEQGDLERFKYFYVFFRPAAFRESAGTTFLDEVWSESETASQELGEDLQDNVFTALRVLGRGFIETNDLEINPDDEESLDELKEQSLVLLYRLMFVLYAEGRGLIHPDSQSAQDEYEENFSLDALRLRIHDDIGEVDDGFEDEYSERSRTMWSRLEDLFRLIDEGEEDLGIPPYNGGLFDHEEHDFLTENEVSNRYLAEVVYRLSTTQNDEGRYVLADYADLDTRHLGSVYEGLLEHQFRIAPEQYAAVAEDGGQVWEPATEVTVAEAVETVPEGGLYVVNDEGERKATGAYYTPDYVVTYIVEETIGPLVEEIRENLVEQGFEPGTQEYLGPFSQRVMDLKILDPAMGSGHFLTKATGFLAEQVMEEVREVETELGVAFDEQHVRREIAKECIYGVDLNGMAVELAKLSMWLETLAADRPLAFLDHHFKEGNSLVGSDITEVLSSDSQNGGQLTLTQAFARVRKETLEHVMELMQDLLDIDNETLDDINSMKEIYEDIQDDPLYQRLSELSNVHTAERFGLDVPEDAYEQMASSIEEGDEWDTIQSTDWFRSAQATVEQEDFFHWELEYPSVFFNEDGEKRSDAGFDIVIGNPPYVFIDSIPEEHRDYFRKTSDTWDYRYDLYGLFIEKGVSITKTAGAFGYIIPHNLLNNNSFRDLRDFLLNCNSEISVVDFTAPVFQDASNEPMLLLTRPSTTEQTQYIESTLIDPGELLFDTWEFTEYSTSSLERLPEKPFIVRGGSWIEDILTSESTRQLGEFVDAVQGLRTGNNTERLAQNQETPNHRKALAGDDIFRYGHEWSGTWTLYDRDLLSSDTAARPREPKYWEADIKILVQEIRNVHLSQRIVASIDEDEYIGLNTTNAIITKDNTDISIYYLMAIISSKLMNVFFKCCFIDNHIATQYLEAIPIYVVRNTDESAQFDDLHDLFDEDIDNFEECIIGSLDDDTLVHWSLSMLAKEMSGFTEKKNELNLDLLDYINPYSEGPALTEIRQYQPPGGVGNSIIAATKEDYENLRIGRVTCERRSESTVVIHVTARYKPDDKDAYETDQWGYTETDPMPAMRLTNLSETEADLIEAFVPVAVEEASGFAGFRETATKTNSLVDRLEAITLPDPNDVADDLERYMDTVERAEELDEKIEKTDNLIDEIVYELYGLTDEEIGIVEEAVSTD